MSTRIPPLLEPYFSPDQSSLVLLTDILGASANWLLLRYIYSYLKLPLPEKARINLEAPIQESEAGVVLVSFLRDAVFWKEGCGKMGLDLNTMNKAGRFIFVDGLTNLFAEDIGSSPSPQPGSNRVVKGSKLEGVRKEIELALSDLKSSRKILIIDGLDCLVAASGGEVTSLAAQDLILHLRERVDNTILRLSADDPLLHSQTTTLEKDHANLVTSIAHSADCIIGLRMLDTGMARDVSGVVRIRSDNDADHREYLYYVGSDSSVKVFERGT